MTFRFYKKVIIFDVIIDKKNSTEYKEMHYKQ